MAHVERNRPFHVRLSDAFLLKLDDWRREQHDLPSRAEAIRQLVEAGMDAKAAKPKRRAP
ncbi:MAG: hypothetical protein KGL39_38090 [Patescibacteria group bacterium]|nr:hypothetical protein [Patescibacteria group bacterium]